MKLLITTSKSLLQLDTQTEEITRIHTGSGLYYGITYSKNKIYIAARNSENPFDYLGKQAHEQGTILVLNQNLQHTHTLQAPFPLRDMHQIMHYDRKIWITCSQDNMVAIFDGKNWKKWYPAPDASHRHVDINHFNSLWAQSNEIYLLAHNLGREPSAIYRYQYPQLKLIDIIPLGNQAHNIWQFKNQTDWYVCDSAQGTIISSQGKVIPVGGFPRGVVITESHYYIGTSDIAERQERHLVDSKMIQYNTHWQPQKEYKIHGQGQILDIKARSLC